MRAKVHLDRTVDWESEASGITPDFSEELLCGFEPATFSKYTSFRTNEGNGSYHVRVPGGLLRKD